VVTFKLARACYTWYPVQPVSGGPADKVLVLKREHRMILLRNGQEICSYRVAIGRNSIGAQTREGDHKTPEGNYILDHKNPQSGFHLAMHVSYPNAVDQRRERALRLEARSWSRAQRTDSVG
jgi:murein L,D-transpeptidase YafK